MTEKACSWDFQNPGHEPRLSRSEWKTMNKNDFSHSYPHCHRAYREDGVWSIDAEDLATRETLASFPDDITLNMAEEDWQFAAYFVIHSIDGAHLGFLKGLPSNQTRKRRLDEENARKASQTGKPKRTN
jgi:hypothetical protein